MRLEDTPRQKKKNVSGKWVGGGRRGRVASVAPLDGSCTVHCTSCVCLGRYMYIVKSSNSEEVKSGLGR